MIKMNRLNVLLTASLFLTVLISCRSENDSMSENIKDAIDKLEKYDAGIIPNEEGKIVAVGFICSAKADEIAALLPVLSDLRSVDGEGSTLTDAGLQKISGLVKLDELDILNCDSLSLEGIRNLRSLKKLRELHFNPKHDADACMKIIAELKTLRILGLAYSTVTDQGLAEISSLANLEIIDLLGVKTFTDKGISYLGNLAHLTKLNLEDTNLGDDGMENIARISTLESLIVSNTQVTDKGISHISGLKLLQTLGLNNTNTDESLKYISGLTNLEAIHLEDTRITDSGLIHLYGLNKLKYVILSKKNFSNDAIKKLELALPNCEIVAEK